MSLPLDLDELVSAVHAITGEWLTAAEARALAASVENREELLAHGIVDLKWFSRHPSAAHFFEELTSAGRLSYEPLPGEHGPAPDAPGTSLSKEGAMALLKQFAESPTDANPLATLRAMAGKRRRG